MLSGLGFVFAAPPLRYPDEAGHYLRTAKVAAQLFGHDSGAGNAVSLPQNAVNDLGYFDGRSHEVTHGRPANLAEIGARLVPAQAEQAHVPIPPNQMVYSGIGYFPQAIAYEAAQAAGAGFVMSLWAGRLAVLIASVAVTVFALALMPFWARWTCAALSLLPTAAFLRGSLSPDAMVIAVTLLGIAAFLDGAEQRNVAWRSTIIALASCIFLALVKPPYICILLLGLLWLPMGSSKIAHPRVALASIAAIAVATIAVTVWHTHAVAPYAAVIRADLPPAAYAPATKLHLLLTSPLSVGAVFAETMLAVPGMIYSMIARFGLSDINPNPLLHVTAIALCIGVIYLDRHAIAGNISLRRAVVLLATFLAQVAFIFGSVWLVWTSTTSPLITAQGRYFLPALSCGVLALAAFVLHPLLKAADKAQATAALMPVLVGSGGALLLAASLVFLVLGEFYGIEGFHVICLHPLCRPQ
jgi:Predicted membrane protein (DUF2142)